MARTRAGFGAVLALLCVAMTVPGRTDPRQLPAQPAAQSSSPPVFVDVVVTSRDPRAGDILGPRDFTVSIDGQPRRVLDVRHVSRGPGAASAAAARQSGTGVSFAAEATRTVLVVVDQSMLRRGEERGVVQAAGALLDRLGLEDRVAIVRLPLASRSPIVFNTDRPGAREALRAVAGLVLPGRSLAATDKPAADNAERIVAADPDRARANDPDKVNQPEQFVPREPANPLPEPEVERAGQSLAAVAGLLKGLQSVPGRKTMVLFSGGLPTASEPPGGPGGPPGQAQIDALASVAAASRTVIYAFGPRSVQADDRQAADFSFVEAVAKRTGGTFAILDRDPVRTVERILPDLSACYVLRVEGGASDAGARPRPLRVETAKTGFTARAASFHVARDDPEDATVTPPKLQTWASLTRPGEEAPRDDRAAARAAELELALSRLGEYVEAYQREFSAVVAEENYLQSLPGRDRRLRSDFLLVHLEDPDTWVSFRDVFEVDGKPVRDRDERLKRLFLENPTAEAVARMKAVQDESSRYNVGNVERNVNVPLFALKVARIWNQARFHFTLRDKGESQGIATWRLDFEERVQPTLVTNPRTHADVPVKGSFLIDALTGAILESRLECNDVDLKGTFVVRYRRDPALGLWVPEEMREGYSVMMRPTNKMPYWSIPLDARATYSNFRRFQVKTEEKIAIPK